MIRKIEEKDYEELKRLVYQIYQLHCLNRPDIYNEADPFPLDFFKDRLITENNFDYVYIENNKICGLIMATKKYGESLPILKQRTTIFIEDIVVDQEYRRKGIGKRLYYFLKEQAMKDSIDAIELNVWAFNESAIKFYESLGMTVKNMKFEQILK